MSDRSNKRQVEAVTRTLETLNKQAEEARAELTGVRRNLSEAQATQLREANEHLVLAALHAKTVADHALANLGEITRVSQHDALTNTANRELMVDRLHNAIALARRHGTRFAVLFIDLDDFKQVNDTLGHVAGDEVLQQTARHLQTVVRDSDTVSRYGGDEFLVLLADVTHAPDAVMVAAKILNAMAGPLHVKGHELHLSVSIGISLYPDDAEDAVTLISRADAAMYRSKRRQRGGYMLYGEAFAGSSSAPCTVELPSRPATRCESTVAAHDLHLHQMREANEHLVLAALTAQEREAHANEMRSKLIASLAVVAHELRAPLAPIRTAVDLMSRAPANEPLLGQVQAMIKGQLVHMARLIDDLLDGSRQYTRTFQLQRSIVEMADILHLAVATCRSALDARVQELQLRLPRRRLPVDGDPVRLVQIFNNLLSNASKYTPKGGRITLTVERSGQSILITLADTGIGITAEALPKIFELFVRDEGAVTLDSRGLGIGLAVVRDLVEAHGGTVVATSAGTNCGSQFVVTLPLAGVGG